MSRIEGITVAIINLLVRYYWVNKIAEGITVFANESINNFAPLSAKFDAFDGEGSSDYADAETRRVPNCATGGYDEALAKGARCFLRKMPGEACMRSDECADVRGTAYYCIRRRCSLPPECPAGHVHVGPVCVPYAVTGGECTHPAQCLSGSLCMHGRCRGPCDNDQLFVEDECVDYEGAGCIARSCVNDACPRAFPVCNWTPQKHNYLCCERAIRMSEHCPHASSAPQVDKNTGEIAHCFDNNCASGYTCQFSRHRHGSYICCSNLSDDFDRVIGSASRPTAEEKEGVSRPPSAGRPPFQMLKSRTRPPPQNVGTSNRVFGGLDTLPPSLSSSAEILRQCCADAECLRRHSRIQMLCVYVFPQPPKLLGLDP